MRINDWSADVCSSDLIADGSCPTFAGAVRVHGKKVDVLLEVPDTRLIERPRVHLVDRTQIDPEVLAHVEVDTGICYASGAGLPLDNMRPGEAILRILAEAATPLERSLKGRGAEGAADGYHDKSGKGACGERGGQTV